MHRFALECGRASEHTSSAAEPTSPTSNSAFYFTVEECMQGEQPDVLLLSSVIHYLPEPYAFLEEVLRHDFPSVVVDRTPYMCDGSTRLTVEHVPAWIYPASYPAWFLSEERFLGLLWEQVSTRRTIPRARRPSTRRRARRRLGPHLRSRGSLVR